MDTDQLEFAINCDPVMKEIVLGVCARDLLPININQRPVGFIVNTDNSDRLRKHWLAGYLESNNYGELFDSYGHSPNFLI